VGNRLSILCAAFLAVSAATVVNAQDPIRVAANEYHLELENRWVRVLRLKLGPHETVPLHEQAESVVVFLTAAREEFSSPGKPKEEFTEKAGGAAHFDSVRRTEKNLTDQPLEDILIELKPSTPDSSAPWPPPFDPMKLDPAHHSVLFENKRVRVLRTVLEPHLKGPLHEHPHYVVVYLTELHTTMTMADGRAIDNPRRPGDVAWRDPLKHITENIGDNEAVEIQVELK
jgi:beta-alanine degradation protein BauB